MFLYEIDLREAFWTKYKNRENIKNYAFEIGRNGGIDLVTFEYLSTFYEYNAFEFKIDNIKKALLQAKFNLNYVHKSWIVLPIEKQEVIKNKYFKEIKSIKGLGVILVKEDGYYDLFIKPLPKEDEDIVLNRKLLELAVHSDK